MDEKEQILKIVGSAGGQLSHLKKLEAQGINVSNYYDDDMLFVACLYPNKISIIREILTNKVIAKKYHYERVMEYSCQRSARSCIEIMMITPIPISLDIKSDIEKGLEIIANNLESDSLSFILRQRNVSIYSIRDAHSAGYRYNYTCYDYLQKACKGVKLGLIFGRLSEQDKQKLRRPEGMDEDLIVDECTTKVGTVQLRKLFAQGYIITSRCMEEVVNLRPGGRSGFGRPQIREVLLGIIKQLKADEEAEHKNEYVGIVNNQHANSQHVNSQHVNSQHNETEQLREPSKFETIPPDYDMYANIELDEQIMDELGIRAQVNIYDLIEYMIRYVQYSGFIDGPQIVLPEDHFLCVAGKNVIDYDTIHRWIYHMLTHKDNEDDDDDKDSEDVVIIDQLSENKIEKNERGAKTKSILKYKRSRAPPRARVVNSRAKRITS